MGHPVQIADRGADISWIASNDRFGVYAFTITWKLKHIIMDSSYQMEVKVEVVSKPIALREVSIKEPTCSDNGRALLLFDPRCLQFYQL